MSEKPRSAAEHHAGRAIVETSPDDGAVRVELGDAVTPRELNAHLSHVYSNMREGEEAISTKLEGVEQRLADVRVDFEKRFGRVEKLILLLAVVIASPKLGGPDLTHAVQTALTTSFG